jgi:hypothetical protein
VLVGMQHRPQAGSQLSSRPRPACQFWPFLPVLGERMSNEEWRNRQDRLEERTRWLRRGESDPEPKERKLTVCWPFSVNQLPGRQSTRASSNCCALQTKLLTTATYASTFATLIGCSPVSRTCSGRALPASIS